MILIIYVIHKYSECITWRALIFFPNLKSMDSRVINDMLPKEATATENICGFKAFMQQLNVLLNVFWWTKLIKLRVALIFLY